MTVIKFADKPQQKIRPTKLPKCPLNQIVNDFFPLEFQSLFLTQVQLEEAAEIRIRLYRPLMILYRSGKEQVLNVICQREQLNYIIERLNQSSVYAWEEEYRRGYITITGGHRVGLSGKALLEGGNIRTMKNISSLNFRIAHQVLGAADRIMPYLNEKHRLCNTLIAAPPGCGKTTLLRDIVRQLSDGLYAPLGSMTVGLVDERSEIAGSVDGESQLEVGIRTDILDGCPKSEGMVMMIRSMSPQVIVTDEIGTKEDINAISMALSAGVKVIATIHGSCWRELCNRPFLRPLLDSHSFERIIFLTNKERIGRLELVMASDGNDYTVMEKC